jgi:hypothetical protein
MSVNFGFATGKPSFVTFAALGYGLAASSGHGNNTLTIMRFCQYGVFR